MGLRSEADLQACKARFSGNAQAFTAVPCRLAARVLVRVKAEEGGKVTTVRCGGRGGVSSRRHAEHPNRCLHGEQTERKANNPGPAPLLFASEQSLSYLDGTRPADYG